MTGRDMAHPCQHTWEWVRFRDGRSVRHCRECGAIRAEMGPKGGEWSWRRNWAFYCTLAFAVGFCLLYLFGPR